MAHSATYSQDDLQDMGLHPVDLLIADATLQRVQPINYALRTELITGLKNTDYANFAAAFLANGNNAFAHTTQKGKLCGFAVPVVRCSAAFPAFAPAASVRLAPQTYMNVTQYGPRNT